MLKVHSEPKKPEHTYQGHPLLALGFRPFFLAAALSAILLLVLWLIIWSGGLTPPPYYGPIGWHSHEMLFGYSAAVIAGFLLTAVRNWTGINMPSGGKLGMLVLFWMLGRIAPALAGVLPAAVIALMDIIFLPAVALSLKPALWAGQQKINRIFVPLLLLMGVANLLVHLQAMGIANTADRGINMMLYLVLTIILMVSGRVVPFFTKAVIPGFEPRSFPFADMATPILMGLLILGELLYPHPWLRGLLALALATTQSIRASGWFTNRVWSIPILWVLHTGLFWVITGFTLIALSGLELVPLNLAKHALTVGGIGVLTLGMMARVALGHTGRAIESHRLINATFIALNLAAFMRVFAPLAMPASYTLWIHLSGTLWVLCFLLFFIYYAPMLARPRIDGKPG